MSSRVLSARWIENMSGPQPQNNKLATSNKPLTNPLPSSSSTHIYIHKRDTNKQITYTNKHTSSIYWLQPRSWGLCGFVRVSHIIAEPYMGILRWSCANVYIRVNALLPVLPSLFIWTERWSAIVMQVLTGWQGAWFARTVAVMKAGVVFRRMALIIDKSLGVSHEQRHTDWQGDSRTVALLKLAFKS